jgi:putative transposase
LNLNRNTVNAHQWRAANDEPPKRCRKSSVQPKALTAEEREIVVSTLNGEDFADQSPKEVYQRLLENGQYLCLVSTMYRLQRELGESGERRQQRPAQHHAIPRLVATRPHEVWTWDIIKLALIRRDVYLSLYVVLDLFSRYIVSWMLSYKENSALANQLMNETVERYQIAPGQLTLHQDRGSPITAHDYLDQMMELDVTCSHSRPRVSNDNPFSESQFKTQTYQPDYSGRFNDIHHTRLWTEEYVTWYNTEHHHSGLAGFTPEQVFTGQYHKIAQTKQLALDSVYQNHPERFVKGRPIVPMPTETVAINPITPSNDGEYVDDRVNFPTLTAAGYVK